MEFIIDNPETEQLFKRIVKAIPSMQNGLTASSMEQRGLVYEKNWGVSVVDLKHFAAQFEKNHLLALKLWNKKWRETMLLATMIDVPAEVTEEQMDYWIKTADNNEIIEQAVINLFTKSQYGFVKALEWCRGKKFPVKYAGLLMMGRLALTADNDIDEMFELFFEVLPPLAKDPALFTILHRSVCQLARHSAEIHAQCVSFANTLLSSGFENSVSIGNEILTTIDNDDFIALIR
jgi:hypothetical protein